MRDRHAAELLRYPEVLAVGVALSYDNPSESAILLFVTKGHRRTNLPAQVEGVRTRIIEGEPCSQHGALPAEGSAALEQPAAPPQLVYAISDAEVARAKVVPAAHVDEFMRVSQGGTETAAVVAKQAWAIPPAPLSFLTLFFCSARA